MFRNYSFAIVDFSKNNPYPPPSQFLKCIQSSTRVDPSRLVVVARNNQRAELQTAAATVRQVQWIDDLSLHQLGLPVPAVKQELASILQAAAQDGILVTSYNGAVLGEIQRLGYSNVDVQSLATFRPNSAHLSPRAWVPSQFVVDATTFTPLNPPAAKPYWRFDGFIGQEEGKMVLLRGLHRRGAVDRRHTVSMPNLKPAMAEVNDRFVGSGYANGTGGMMAVLAGGAHFDGLVEAAVSYNGTPYYWLTARALQILTAPDSVGSPSTSVGETPATALVRSPVTVATPTESENVRDTCAADATAVVRPARERSPHKSQRMQDALIVSGCGPRTKQRIPMLDLVGSILDKRDKSSLTDILDNARDALMQEISDGPEKKAAVAAINAVRKMLRDFLPASGALRDIAAKPIPKGFKAGPTSIADFDPDWRMRTEAQLLLRLVAVFREPIDAEHDVENIVGALYHVRSGPERRELKRRVENMIGYLLDKGFVHEAVLDDGHRVLTLGPAETGEPLAPSANLRLAQNG